MNEKPLFILNTISPRVGLFEQVISIIQKKQHATRLWRIRVSVSAGILSAVALVPVGISLAASFAASHFGVYVSLIFSDTAVALSYWKQIGVSLLESLPATGLTLTIALLGVLLWSMRTAVRSMANHSITNYA